MLLLLLLRDVHWRVMLAQSALVVYQRHAARRVIVLLEHAGLNAQGRV